MTTSKKNKRKKGPASLSNGRPPILQKRPPSMTSKATRTLVRSHHQLQKRLARAEDAGDSTTADAVRARIEQQGGLPRYQAASMLGQSGERGGDTSKVMMEWLGALRREHGSDKPPSLRMLEVGALSPTNACARSGVFAITRIDLHAQHKSIEQQDFMERPLPDKAEEGFDVVSLSLVLNYVPTAAGRGEMLQRTAHFLRPLRRGNDLDGLFPALFLVLPLPCVANSRYLDEARLGEIMQSLDYTLVEQKRSSKLAYYLWRYNAGMAQGVKAFKKTEVNPGRLRNNFAIVLE